MAGKEVRRSTTRPEKWAYTRPAGGSSSSKTVCVYWIEGRCTKKFCRFLHSSPAPPRMNPSMSKQRAIQNVNACTTAEKNNAIKKSLEKVCKYWAGGQCSKGERCPYLHTWFHGAGFSMLPKLQGHKKAITGIALPNGTDKLYSAGTDGTVRVWNCHTGECVSVLNLGGEAGSLISEDPWIFVGAPNVVKAWNIHTNAEFSLNGPVGQVHSMVIAKQMLFAGAQNGIILAWKGCSESNPFQLAATLEGHTQAVVCLTFCGSRLYSASVDHTIRVWNLDTLQCVKTLNGHSDVVMSLTFWGPFLLSCSLDCTIKVWAATEGDNFEVTYTRKEEHKLSQSCFAHAMTTLFAYMNYHHSLREADYMQNVKFVQFRQDPMDYFSAGTRVVSFLSGIGCNLTSRNSSLLEYNTSNCSLNASFSNLIGDEEAMILQYMSILKPYRRPASCLVF